MLTNLRRILSLIVIAFASTATFYSCSGTTDEEKTDRDIEEAREMIAEGDCAEAKLTCDDLVANGNLSARQLAALSVIYMQMSERDDMEDNTAMAFQCFRNAFKADADSAAAFYAAVGGEDARYVQMLEALMQIVENPRCIEDFEPCNSDDHQHEEGASHE